MISRIGVMSAALFGLITIEASAAYAQGAAPAAPAAPDLAKVTSILDKHCARCHEAGKTTGRYKEKPAGNFGYVLNAKALQKRGLLHPGNAEDSAIFQKITKGEMPKDIDDNCYEATPPAGAYCGPDKEEVATLRTWINAYNPATGGGPPRPYITDTDVIRAVSNDLNNFVDPRRRANLRYLTLTNLWNAGDDEDDLNVYRMSIYKLLNSLSTRSDPARIEPIDRYKTVFRFDISDLGWDYKLWDRVVALNPYVIFYKDPQFRFVQAETKTVAPIIRADWFSFVASKPPLYYDLLGFPKTLHELEKLLGFSSIRDIQNVKVARAGFQRSGVSQNNRLLERHAIATGAYWQSYDFATNENRKSFFLFPLGPINALGDLSKKFGFDPDGGEYIFELPNGFHAYYLTDAKGNRIDVGPTTVVQDPSRRDQTVTNGISCFGCHDQGIKYNPYRPREQHDQVRDLTANSLTFPTEARDVIKDLYPPHPEFARLMEGDGKRYEHALRNAGVNMRTKLGDIEMINALFKRFEENLTPQLAAAEVGLPVEEFMERLNAAGREAYDLKNRLKIDLVPRDQFVKLFAPLVNTITDNKAVDFTEIKKNIDAYHKTAYAGDPNYKPNVPDYQRGAAGKLLDVAAAPQVSKSFDLSFITDATDVHVHQPVKFRIRTEQPCYLTLINTDAKDRSQVLFPNKFNTNNLIKPGAYLDVPGPHIKGFEFRTTEPGVERVIAICNASRQNAVVPDYKSGNFTQFDNYGQLLESTRSVKLLQVKPTGGGSATHVPVGPSGSGAPPVAFAPPTLTNPYDPKVDIVAQKAIVLKVRR